MPERQVEDRPRPPAADVGAQCVDLIPALPLFERRHVLEACPAVGAARAPDAGAGAEALAPHAVGLLPAAAARDPELRILGERGQEPLEVVLGERDVGVELHDDVGRALHEQAQALPERADDRRAAHGCAGAGG